MKHPPPDLMFLVPPGLAAGEYTLKVRAPMGKDGPTRTGRLRHPLTVTV